MDEDRQASLELTAESDEQGATGEIEGGHQDNDMAQQPQAVNMDEDRFLWLKLEKHDSEALNKYFEDTKAVTTEKT